MTDLPEGVRLVLIAALEVIGAIRCGESLEELAARADDFYVVASEHIEIGDE